MEIGKIIAATQIAQSKRQIRVFWFAKESDRALIFSQRAKTAATSKKGKQQNAANREMPQRLLLFSLSLREFGSCCLARTLVGKSTYVEIECSVQYIFSISVIFGSDFSPYFLQLVFRIMWIDYVQNAAKIWVARQLFSFVFSEVCIDNYLV